MNHIKLIAYILFFISVFSNSKQSRIVIESLTIRHLQKNALGLIFDAVLTNTEFESKETLNFDVQSEKCCLLINGSYDCDTQNLYGTKVSNLEPGKQIVVSLLWPTLILFNRIGNCTVKVVTHHAFGTKVDDTRLIHFNTTINPQNNQDYMLYYFNDMKSKYGYTKCESEDLNPFNKCKPVNCELKYFGRRNFFKYKHCIPVESCENDSNVIYDYETNKCRNIKEIMTNEDMVKMKSGHFENWIEKVEVENETENDEKIGRVLRRVRRSLNDSQTFADMIITSLLFIIKFIVLAVFVYLMVALLISILFYFCIGCGIISNSVTMNILERLE